MKVKVVDRELQDKLWGNGYRSIHQIIKVIEISDRCPLCGGLRGRPKLERFCENGEFYTVSTWRNPCGHLDRYCDVIQEASGGQHERR